MKHIDISELNAHCEDYIDKDVVICGWVKSVRNSKQTCFIDFNDGTGMKNVQIVVDKSEGTDESWTKFSIGTALMIKGKAVASFNEKQRFEIKPEQITVLGACPEDYPLQKKATSLEFLRTVPHLRARTNTFNAMFRLRSKLAYAIHEFFQTNNFTYVHTPLITGSDCEGAGEVFRVTTQPANAVYPTEDEYFAEDFFKRRAGLTVSGQLEGETMAMALSKIYTFGPTFRAELSYTARHAAEFWQIEPEVAFADLDDIIELATNMIKYITNYVLVNCPEEIAFFEQFYEKGLTAKLRNIVDSEFAVIDYSEAIDLLVKSGREFSYPVEWGLDLQTEHERYLTDEVFRRPVFVINYPKDIKAFYMKQNPDGKTVAATDLLVPGVGEIIGASQREDDYDKLYAVMTERGMTMDDYKYYLDLRKFGTAPHAGYGLGFERMLMYITGIGNIRDTIAYPRTAGYLA
ncbi:MAG: asparagine--tRNA ligase [Eubacteriaceae bacterium]|nr:asparagine--tRNA ligase [Eubacteriaceae bacterium]